jgi:hypothetical protein
VKGKISKDSLRKALIELKVDGCEGEAFDKIFSEFDLDHDGQIDFAEFSAAVLKSSYLESWCKRIPWWQAIADAIPRGGYEQPLRAVANLTDPQIDVICAEVKDLIRQQLREQRDMLSEVFDAMDLKSAKDQGFGATVISRTFKASVGTCQDYHRGIKDRVGKGPYFSAIYSLH